MAERLQFDGALKQFFERQQPSLVMDLTGGVAVKQSLNVELPRVQERKVDLVLLLADESLLHIEFQGTNRKDMAIRMSEYYLLLLARYQCPIRQVVLYVGRPRMRMSSVLEHGPLRFSYSLRDIREWPARKLLDSSRTADYVLAILAGTADGPTLVREILQRVSRRKAAERDTAIAYLAALSGLRRFETILVQEAKRMGLVIDWKKNEILRGIHEEGREEGREVGREEALRFAVRTTLTAKFGNLPRWVEQRVRQASTAQLTEWLTKSPVANRLDEVVHRR